MEVDTFQYPPNMKKIAIHTKANRIGKLRTELYTPSATNQIITNNIQKCPDCNRIVSQCPKLHLHESQQQLQQRYGIYGPNCVIYLGFIKRIAIFMFICTLIVGIPMFVINLLGTACSVQNYCITNTPIYTWSVYNVIGVDNGLMAQVSIWLGFCFIMIGFNVYLRKYALQTYRRINDKNITDSDYSLLLRRLPQGTTQQDIRNMIGQIIVSLNQDPNTIKKINPSSIRDIIIIKKQDETYKNLKRQIHYFKKAAKRHQKQSFVYSKLPEPIEFANAAIVRFDNMYVCKAIARSVETNFIQKILHFICIFYNKKTQYEIKGNKISLQNAPHPTDLQWQNFGFSERTRIVRKTLLTLTLVAVLIASGVVALIFSYWMQLVTNSQGRRPVILTIIIVLIVLIFNKILRKIAVYTTKRQRLDSKTDKRSEQILLFVISQSLNLAFFTIIVPILVQLPDYIASQTTKSSSFPLVMFVTIIAQALVMTIFDFLVYILRIHQAFKIWLDNKKIKLATHTQALNKFKGIQVPIVKCYAFNVRIVWFSFVYGVVSPICIFIGFLGMLLTYIFQRILFNQRYSIPAYTGPKVNYQMIQLLNWTPLLVGIFNLFMYRIAEKQRNYQFDNRIMAVIISMIVLGAVNLLIPWQRIVKKLVKRQQNESDLIYNPNNMQITYQQSNPFGSRLTPNILYRQPKTFQNIQKIQFPSNLLNVRVQNNQETTSITPRSKEQLKKQQALSSQKPIKFGII